MWEKIKRGWRPRSRNNKAIAVILLSFVVIIFGMTKLLHRPDPEPSTESASQDSESVEHVALEPKPENGPKAPENRGNAILNKNTIGKVDPLLFNKFMSRSRIYPTNGPRIAFINRQYGSHADFSYIANHLDFQYTEFHHDDLFRHIDPTRTSAGWLSEEDASSELFVDLANNFCSRFDIVVVADVSPDIRFLLQHVDRQPHKCGIKKLILLTTQLFNYYADRVQEEEEIIRSYEDLLVRVSSRTLGPRILWVASHPWEGPYAALRLGSPFLNYTLIRPFGIAVHTTDVAVVEDDRQFAVVLREGNSEQVGLYQLLKDHNIPVKSLDSRDGISAALAAFRAYIELPHQVSCVSMYENMANGVITFIPSARFFEELVSIASQQTLTDGPTDRPEGRITRQHLGFNLISYRSELLTREWIERMDYYSPEFKDYFVVFDSFDELRRLLEGNTLDLNQLRKKQLEMYKKLRIKSLKQWSGMLSLDRI